MKTTIEFLDALKTRYDLPSDYALAKFLGVTKASISYYRNRKSFFDDSVAEHVAKLLKIDTGYVIACVHSERARKESEKAIWQRIADRFTDSNGDPICIMSTFINSNNHGFSGCKLKFA